MQRLGGVSDMQEGCCAESEWLAIDRAQPSHVVVRVRDQVHGEGGGADRKKQAQRRNKQQRRQQPRPRASQWHGVSAAGEECSCETQDNANSEDALNRGTAVQSVWLVLPCAALCCVVALRDVGVR